MEYKIDAEGKKLGRLASEVATLLMGKNSPDFAKHKVADVKVIISNSSLMNIEDKKLGVKRYKSFSGYPSGLKIKTGKAVALKHGYGELIKHAVKGMLPGNKLRDKLLKNIEVTE